MSESTLHRAFRGRKVHVPFSFEFSNAAQREAAGDYVSTDLGKFALQLNDNSLWMLTAVTPTWKEVGKELSFEAVGDLLFGGEDGVALRLAIGANGTVLGAQNGQPVWVAGGVPPGTMIDWPSENPPDWALVMDGAEYDRDDYAELFAVIGTAYGEGDGVTTFNVPDQRGRFRRGVPDGGTVSTYENDDIKSHNHAALNYMTSTSAGIFSCFVLQVDSNSSSPSALYTGHAGGSETLPKNIHVLPIIAY